MFASDDGGRVHNDAAAPLDGCRCVKCALRAALAKANGNGWPIRYHGDLTCEAATGTHSKEDPPQAKG